MEDFILDKQMCFENKNDILLADGIKFVEIMKVKDSELKQPI